ncbi:PRC-barrel domain containing protein [Polymorphobacter fuscus]|uniref:PRC-barrel domain containing protein n=2 Tax=Sandarakinorhabdus fusca TaxID=1439888 RepID=A0A7C9KW93_9SPHN|nr:PRC-barrel domain containing protein [Polymorphobacter fuscus]MQT15766.1 PRC-barrel domain containing protein [Polymorphobacter fuscus]
MLAALMTAANLGARVTGWGFVVFTIGSIGWIIVGLGSGQSNLVATNAFLTLVNVIGIWRWLGRQARYESVGASAEEAGHAPDLPTVLPATGIVGRTITDADGRTAGEAVEAILDCDTGTIRHLVVRFGGVGGIGEQIVALPIADIRLATDTITTPLRADQVASLPRLDARLWPRLLKEESVAAA